MNAIASEPQIRHERASGSRTWNTKRIAESWIIPPPPYHGIHCWLLEAAWECRKQGATARQAIEILVGYDGMLRRPLQPLEAHRAVERAYSTVLEGKAYTRSPRVPLWNEAETTRLTGIHGTTHVSLRERSPVVPDDTLTQLRVLEGLFPDPAGLLCIGKDSWRFHTGCLAEHGEIGTSQFIVPAYMTATTGVTLDGKVSMHAKSNTGPRRFIVCDFDGPPSSQHASIITQLETLRPLILVVHSGGKSLHAWFPVINPEEDEIFWKVAVALGADPALWRNPSSFVRLPLGLRDNGVRQQVLFFNPDAIPA